MEKKCLSCGEPVTGRIDKKFCNDSCRTEFHNFRKANPGSLETAIENTIRNNRRILLKLASNGTTQIREKELAKTGFNFKAFTGVEVLEPGLIRFLCYEFALQQAGRDYLINRS